VKIFQKKNTVKLKITDMDVKYLSLIMKQLFKENIKLKYRIF